jgi:glucokinase
MEQDARQWLSAQPGRGRRLRELVGENLQALTGQHLSQAADQGDDLAWEILERSARSLGIGIGNAANLINPQRFILGGGVTKAGNRFWEVIRNTARITALPEIQFEILPAQLGDDAPLWGAVVLAQACLAET